MRGGTVRKSVPKCRNSSDRRKRLSHFGAEGPAFLWGRRFRLPSVTSHGQRRFLSASILLQGRWAGVYFTMPLEGPNEDAHDDEGIDSSGRGECGDCEWNAGGPNR